MAKDLDKTTPALAVFGLDASKKAHGSYFGQDEVDRAIKAANDMGMFALRVVGDELASLAAKLPRGKLFDSGNAFIPFTKGELVRALVTAGEAQGPSGGFLRPAVPAADRPAKPRQRAATAPIAHAKREGAPQPYTLPSTWADIGVGSLVLVVEALEDGYHPAIVQAVGPEAAPEDRSLQLAFRDFPDYPRMTRKLTEVALVHLAATSHLA